MEQQSCGLLAKGEVGFFSRGRCLTIPATDTGNTRVELNVNCLPSGYKRSGRKIKTFTSTASRRGDGASSLLTRG